MIFICVTAFRLAKDTEHRYLVSFRPKLQESAVLLGAACRSPRYVTFPEVEEGRGEHVIRPQCAANSIAADM